jgi:predicted metal-binding protein
MTTWITICDTCKREGWDAEENKITDGERFAELIEAAASEVPNLRTRRVSCLMGCTNACNVTIQNPAKLSYTLGQFEAESEAAEGIVAYATAHAESATGQVPYREWPQAIKGHFVTRHPPVPVDDQ